MTDQNNKNLTTPTAGTTQRNRHEQVKAKLLQPPTIALFNVIINTLPILIVTREAKNGRILSWNRAAEEITGLAAADVIGKRPRDLHNLIKSPKQLALLADDDRKIIASGESLSYPHLEINSKQGRRVLHLVKTPVMLDSKRPLIISVAQDITHQFDLEQNSENQQQLTQALLNAIDVQIALLDDKGTIIALNKAWKDLTRISDPQRPLLAGTNLSEELRSAMTTNNHPCGWELISGLNSILTGTQNICRQLQRTEDPQPVDHPPAQTRSLQRSGCQPARHHSAQRGRAGPAPTA